MLMTLADVLEQERSKKRQPLWKATSVQFVREGEKPPTTAITRTSLVPKAQSWEMKVDLGRKAAVPPDCPDSPEAGCGALG